MDLLNKKEIEAVILHEIAHLKRKASVLTTSLSILKVFSPMSLIARFHNDFGDEEYAADTFAIKEQKTGRHIASAKRKIDGFYSAKSKCV